ncbi:MAG: asparagine synthase (glutamine-hydrolyzing) [Marinobacter sp.]|uniref:asparagine synthase (glutamine-hydrolyzing) n=1 Tax=Marinobacter sp. TaxID=50741 RepID=UPI001B415935|nr:asparagine synthase (glutamine-hydrolyzing) [Marinobacter sp.]MBQ0745372.1 asparagine synthase (glutamine-hydrolyzing) [Marinobacter sp.]MBQ0816139.1 asparagine synthase (glutamine-hydrolyzing) [Marinobacter sp.]|tara:strand:- start:121 stop:2010 length:1890 start_codon:yes stop_codon:yes gene_type:complete
MCGLAGFLRTATTPDRDAHQRWLDDMGQAIIHRGPDAGSTWLDDAVGLVHRRLSIIDLSDAGTQPMVSASGRYVIAYNGEIYNFQELRDELTNQGHSFRTRTDTEVLLALYEIHGPSCLQLLNGMFALAIWDRTARKLFLARDRLGKKPLYFYEANGQFAFASELKALTPAPFVKTELRHDAIKDFFAYQYIPDPKTIYKNVHKLAPGYWLVTDGTHTRQEQYWDVSFGAPSSASLGELEDGLYNLIDDAVRLRMVSDVPLGAFLSGGIDSSAVVGLMAGHTNQPVTTCAIGFDSKRFDEVHWAKKVAEQFKTDHHEFTVKDNVAESLASIARFFDEPFADPSFVPTYFVSQLARQKVTVALAGDGGDENFAGYSKYYTDHVENRLRGLFPAALRHNLFPGLARLAGMVNTGATRKARSLLGTLALDPDEAFFITNSFFRRDVWNDLVKGELKRETHDYDPAEITRAHYKNADTDNHLSSILYTDIKTYLPGDILVKVDRMSMANSLETRAPLLDYRVVEYAAQIPSAMKLHGKEKKFVLKKAFEKLLPEEVLYRKKMGFSVPLAQWLRNELFELAEGIFNSNEGGLAQCFDMRKVRRLWQNHQRGEDKNTQELWSMVAFELWWRNYNR